LQSARRRVARARQPALRKAQQSASQTQHETCPVSTGGGTRRVQLVREGRGDQARHKPSSTRLRASLPRHWHQRECTVGTWVGATVGGGGEGDRALPNQHRLHALQSSVKRLGRELAYSRDTGRGNSRGGGGTKLSEALCKRRAHAGREPVRLRAPRRRGARRPPRRLPGASPPSLPYKVDTSRPSLRTNWTRPAPPLRKHRKQRVTCVNA
jgi:hypothetical protein